MASRYHWVSGGSSGGFTVGSPTSGSMAALPAGARLLKIIVQPRVSYRSQVAAFASTGNYYVLVTININSTDYPSRMIWQEERSLALGFSVTQAAVPYNVVATGAMKELGEIIDCSYGGPGKAPITISWSILVAKFDTQQSGGTGPYNMVLRALYYL